MQPHAGPLSAIHAWIDAFNATDVPRIVALYAPDAVLWGTLATELITTPDALRAYFERALGGVPGPSVELQDTVVQSLDGTAVVSGAYLLQLSEAAGRKAMPARFTIVLRQAGGAWVIASHHSSALPGANRTAAAGTAGWNAEDRP